MSYYMKQSEPYKGKEREILIRISVYRVEYWVVNRLY